jgi:hypothetical protein
MRKILSTHFRDKKRKTQEGGSFIFTDGKRNCCYIIQDLSRFSTSPRWFHLDPVEAGRERERTSAAIHAHLALKHLCVCGGRTKL